MNYGQWLKDAQEQLQQAGLAESAKLDAQLLLQQVTGKNRAYLLAFAETELSPEQIQQLTALLQQRLLGKPMAYILDEKEFWSLPLWVSEHTLIPRPDTEILVERAVEIAKNFRPACLPNKELAILDLGTGTGAIALALASELTPWAADLGISLKILGVDRIAQAVELAQKNAKRHHLAVDFRLSHWFEQLSPMQFHLIVSNPPYIDKADPHLHQGDVRFEPHSALVAEQQGMADLQFIIEQAPRFLAPNGYLLLEHGWQQAEKVRSIFAKNNWATIETIKDYAGHSRVSLARSATT